MRTSIGCRDGDTSTPHVVSSRDVARGTRRRRSTGALCGPALVLGLYLGHAWNATAVTTTAGSSGAWHSGATWDNGVPAAGYDAVVPAGVTVTIGSASASLNSLTNSGTLVFTNWATSLSATYVRVSAGEITHAGCNTNPVSSNTNRVYIICSNLTVDSGAAIDVDAKGYAGSTDANGQGPGGGTGGPYPALGGGGGHGGKGGQGGGTGYGGPTYGLSNAPVWPGSGGGGYNGVAWSGSGGGAVRIQASGTVTVKGSISAIGQDSPPPGYNGRGAGSGGSIYISCRSIVGPTGGCVRADGGYSGDLHYGGSGGGGRVALTYSGSDHFYGAASAQAGEGLAPARVGDAGTVYRRYTGTDPLLTITGSPAEYGTPSPYPYGVVAFPTGTAVTNSAPATVDGAGGSKLVCSGWSATTNGLQFAGGVTTQAVFQMPALDAVLTWNWEAAYQLTETAGPNGTASTNLSGYYSDGASVQLGATADVSYVFSQWTGDVPDGGYTNNPLTVTMDASRAVRAHFAGAAPGTKSWSGTGSWTNDAGWTPPGMPGPLDAVTILSGNVTIHEPTWIASMAVNSGATVTFADWSTAIDATDVTVWSGGTLTHLPCDTNTVPANSNRVYLVCSNFTLSAGASIDVNEKGFLGGNGNGQGPGGGGGGPYPLLGGGGGYGGRGGPGGNGTPGVTYGSASAPVDPGSGGGGRDAGPLAATGGGAVRIQASGEVAVNGTITADGGVGSGGYGAGSGGGVYITCRTFTGGTGLIVANGGPSTDVNYSGSGGGGRIAVITDPAAQQDVAPKPAVQFSAQAGSGAAARVGEMGTVYFEDTAIVPDVLRDGRIIVNAAGWAPSSVTITNAQVELKSGVQFAVTNDLTVDGNGVLIVTNPTVFTIGGDAVLTNGGALQFYSGTNVEAALVVNGNLTLDWGTLLVSSAATNGATTNGALVDVVGNVTVTSSSWVYSYSHPVNGGSPLFRMRNLTVSGGTGGGFSAGGTGWAGTPTDGYGPGFGHGGMYPNNPYGMGNGAGYGGIGGLGGYNGQLVGVGTTYGNSNAPVLPGSGGGGYNGAAGGRGGGLLRIEVVRNLTLNGLIAADGARPTGGGNVGGGSGSGGGVYITCWTLRGDGGGVCRANGGDAAAGPNSGGGGGGGRIAVWSVVDSSGGTITTEARGGTHDTPACHGTAGTIVWGLIDVPRGTLITVR